MYCLVFLVVVLQAPVGDAGGGLCNTPGARVLLDSYAFPALLPSPWTTTMPGGWNISSSTRCFQSVAVCDASAGQNNLLVTDFVVLQPPELQFINVLVEYVCPSFSDTCNTDFSLHIYETSIENRTESLNLDNYIEIVPVVLNNSEITRLLTMRTGFYLAFQDTSSCVEITRVRVLDATCPSVVNAFVGYPVASSGTSVNGNCVEGAVLNTGSLTTQCLSNGSFDFGSGSCHCMGGWEQSNDSVCSECQQGFFKRDDGNSMCEQCPVNSGNEGTGNTDCDCDMGYRDAAVRCSECDNNFFMNSGMMCFSCPDGSTSPGGEATACTCNSALAIENGDTLTMNQPCNSCRDNYFRSSTGCVSCPAKSSRSFGDEDSVCFCDSNGATASNAPNTTGLDCVGCAAGFFMGDSGMCTPCPSNSMSINHDDISCTCNEGTTLPGDAGDMTTSEPCESCDAGFYRADGVCIDCPANSERLNSADPEQLCTCISIDYMRRVTAGFEGNCLPLVGFGENKQTFEEGADNKGAVLILSVPTTKMIQVSVGLSNMNADINITVETSVVISANASNGVVGITSPDDQTALEEEISFILNITVGDTPLFVAGNFTTTQGRRLYSSVMVTIVDDDVVNVGFTESKVSFNESTASAAVIIERLQDIGSELSLRIISDDDRLIELLEPDVRLTNDTSAEQTVLLSIRNDGARGNREVMLRLEYSGPPRFNDFVNIGGGETNGEIVITIIDDDSPPSSAFPVEAIIGVCAGGAGIAVLLLMIIILCLCICRLRVNRQGFYHTYENKTSEPPTMLRYSASLRSISSQTVIPVTEGRSVQKENEFYV